MYALLAGFHKQVLQVEQGLLGRIHVDERGCDTGLATTTRTADLVDVVLDLLRHGEDDDVLDIVEVKPFGGNARSDHHVFCARLERLDCVLTLLLRCGRMRQFVPCD